MKSLIINPGSTSTKIAVFKDRDELWSESIEHKPEELKKYPRIYDQLPFRKELVRNALERRGTALDEMDVIMSRGGLLPPVRSGAYQIDQKLVETLRDRPVNEHASNVGAGIALELAEEIGVSAYIYDPVTVDEMIPVVKITGLSDMERKGIGHNLNMRACAIRYAEEIGKSYRSLDLIVAHLGGGITMSLHNQGRIADMISDDEGPFSPERAGGLPSFQVIRKMEREQLDARSFLRLVQRQGGLMSYFGTSDAREVQAFAEEGDEKAKIVLDAMALNIAKNIAKLAVVLDGEIDSVLLTGGLAHSEKLVNDITRRVSFIAPVRAYPGEFEMEALAGGAYRLFNGEETANRFEG